MHVDEALLSFYEYKYVASLSAELLGCSPSGRIARSVINCPTCSCCNSADILNFSCQISKLLLLFSTSYFSFPVNTADICSLLLSLVVDYSPPPAQSSAAPTSLFPLRSSRFFLPFSFLAFFLFPFGFRDQPDFLSSACVYLFW